MYGGRFIHISGDANAIDEDTEMVVTQSCVEEESQERRMTPGQKDVHQPSETKELITYRSIFHTESGVRMVLEAVASQGVIGERRGLANASHKYT